MISVLPLSALADAVKVGDLWYELNDANTTAEVTRTGDYSYSGDITIPATIEYNSLTYTVTSVGDNAFSNSSDLNSVVISEGIKLIDSGAFISCYNMTRVEIPSTVTTINAYAFAFCSSLTTVISNIQEPFDIDKNTFASQTWTVNSVEVSGTSSAILYVPTGTRSKYQALAGWSTLPTIFEGERKEATSGDLKYEYATGSLEAAVISGDYSAMESVTIPASVTIDGVDYSVKAIGFSAFYNCYNMSSVTFSEGLAAIGKRAFGDCYSANFSALPSTIRYIGQEAFRSCNRITNLVIPEGCTTIGQSAFNWCNGIRKVEIPSTVTSIEVSAFMGLENASTIISRIQTPFVINPDVFSLGSTGSYNDAGEWISSYTPSEATLYVPDNTKSAYQAIEGWNMFADIQEGELKEVTVGGLAYSYVEGKGVATVIGRANEEITTINIPATVPIGGANYSVKSVAVGAFRDCNIDTLVMSSGLETIGKRAFQSCWRLKNVEFPSTVKSLGQEAFRGCNSLQRVSLPSSLTSIGDEAFYGCSNLFAVVSKIQTPFNISQNVFALGSNGSYDDSGNYVNTYTPSSAILYVPVGTSSAYQAIAGWNMFAEIIEGELKAATVDGLNYSYVEGKGTATVTGRANSELRNITIPGSVPIDGTNYSVKSVGAGAFQENYIDTLVIQEGVETIEKNAFKYNYSSLRSVTLPSSLKTIGDEAFYYSYGFKNLTIPEGVTTIAPYAFYYCNGLQKLVLPSSLDSIGNNAFYECNNLSSVISKIRIPFTISQNVFALSSNGSYDDSGNYVNTYTPSSATLYVPVGTSSAYQAIAGWNMFAEIVEGELKEATVDGLTYSYVEGRGSATVTGRANEELRNITIPGSVPIDGTNYSVKSVAAGAFQNVTNIDTLVIQSGVETIGKNAFQYCYNLKSVTISEGVKTIGENAFRESGTWSPGLRKIELPSSLDSIGDYAFFYCRNLTSVVSKIQNPFAIKENVFASSWANEENGVTTWPKSSANLYVPEGTKARYEAIAGWNMFAGIYEGELLEREVGDLKYAYLPSTLTATVISGNYSELRKVTIPGTVDIDGTTYQVKEIGTGAFRNCSRLDTVVINNGIQIIGREAFQDCYNTEFAVLPSSVRAIGDWAFRWCNRIKNFELPEGLESIGAAAFAGCNSLQKIILPSTLTSIGENVFNGSNNLSSVVSHIREPFEISERVFAASWSWDENNKQVFTPSAATLFVPEGTKALYEAIPGWTMFAAIYEGELIEQKVGDLYYSYNTSSRFATVVRGDSYSELTKVEVPGTVEIEGITCQVKEIASRAFSGTPITSLVIVEGLESIGQEAFSSCQQLSTISLPSSLTTIGEGAFRGCRRLTSVVIPSGVNSLGNGVFSGCVSINSMDVAEGNETFESRGSNAIIESRTNMLRYGCKNTIIPSSVTAIDEEAFFECQMTSIQIPSSVKTIGGSAFNSCRKLTEITLPEGVETVEHNAFSNCESLTMIEFPNTLKTFGYGMLEGSNHLMNIVSNIESPTELRDNVFGSNDIIYSQATLWVPRGKVNTYKALEGWNRFELYDELLRDTLTKPTITYNGHYVTMANNKEQRANIYYSLDGSEPTILCNNGDTIAISNLGVIQAISKRFGSYTVDTTRYEVTYVFDGVTARTASGGLLKNAFEWCGTDKVEMLDVVGELNDDDFGTIRGLSKLTTLNMAGSKITNGAIPAEAFANTKLQWYVSPYSMTSVGTNIFKGCSQLSAITWNSSSVELPEDVVTDVANPNMLVYAKAQAMIPYALKNVVVNGYANNIILSDSAGNNNFYCPEEFIARRISYTHNYQQPTLRGTTQGWETLALPFTVGKITHETKGVITPSTVEGAERPFWLYELGDNGLTAATQIRANIPYLICMPNDDAYGDEYILGGRVTFSAQNVTITTSGGTTVSQGDRQFVPTYKAVAKADGVYALNIGEAYNGNPMGSVFVQNYREVRPFEAYSVHSGSRSRTIPVSSLGGGDATGINDLRQNDDEAADAVVKVYTLSGALVKQGKREDVLRSLPKGLYIINGKKVIK